MRIHLQRFHFESMILKNLLFSDEPRNSNVNKSSSPDPDLGLFLDAFATCDGFTFNVTRTAGPPAPAELQIRSASQWAVLSRDLVEDLLDQVHSFGLISTSQFFTHADFAFLQHTKMMALSIEISWLSLSLG